MPEIYRDDLARLFLGDCRQNTEWLDADLLVMDPPYGRAWSLGAGVTNHAGAGSTKGHPGIAGDRDTGVRDAALELWFRAHGPAGLAIVFGDPLIAPPARTVQALIYAKPADAGIFGARAGFRRDAEMIYLVGAGWPAGIGGRSSILGTGEHAAGPASPAARFGHPHAKPGDLLRRLVSLAPGRVADPFAGSGTTLVAAKQLGRPAIGVEIDPAHATTAAGRLAAEAALFPLPAL